MNVYILTLGCPKNEYDSECLGGLLLEQGFDLVRTPEEADAIIVNTCGFIQDAKKESIDAIFDMARAKKPGAVLAVTGCLSQRYGAELFEEIPEAELILGVNDYEKLPEMIRQALDGRRMLSLSPEAPLREGVPGRNLDVVHTATLKIAEGCDNCCAYCVIPSIRGGYRSRRQEDLLAEARMLAAKGCRELILIAQDVTAYGTDLYGECRLPALLKDLCAVPGLAWIRLMYCYEDRITDELIRVMAEEPKICPYLDIPLQHVSPRILSAMGRRSTPESIRGTLARLRKAIPDLAVRTTFIVGFPGETEEDFELLRDFMEEQDFERVGVFAYSREEGTPAAAMEHQVAESVSHRRKEQLMLDQLSRSRAKNAALVGRTLTVLVDRMEESDSESSAALLACRTVWDAPEIDQEVLVATLRPHKPGDFLEVRITDAFDYDLTGEEV